MKIIDVIELNENGVEVGKEDNPMTFRHFDDNGGLPDGNYDEDNIEGVWVLIDGKETDFDVYAHRSIDDATLVPIKEFKNYIVNRLTDIGAKEINRKKIKGIWPRLLEKVYDCDEYMRFVFFEDEVRYLPDGHEPYPLAFDNWDNFLGDSEALRDLGKLYELAQC